MSVSGTETYQRLATALTTAQNEVQELENRLGGLTESRTQLQLERQDLLAELAQVRLKYGELGASGTQELGERVRALLQARDTQHTTILEKSQLVAKELARRAAEVKTALDAQAQAETTLHTAEEALFTELEAQPDYQQQYARAERAARTLQHALEKAEASKLERDEKGEKYLADPLFNYLWNRKFGTPEYQPKSWFANLVRSLDQWVARMSRYEENRQNFERLQALPKWIAAHSEEVGHEAQAAADALAAYIETHRADSPVPAAEEQLAAATRTAEAREAELEHTERELVALDAQDREFAEGKDQAYAQAMELLKHTFERKNLAQLERDALLTPYPEDDLIVAKLNELADRLAAVQSERSGLTEAVERGTKRVQELAQAVRNYRQSPLNRDTVSYPDGRKVEDTIHKVLTGLLTVEALSRYLSTNAKTSTPSRPAQMPRTPPRAPARTTSSFGRSAGGSSTVRRSSSPTRSSGSFRTGGSSRGGGFKTGGRF